MGVLSVASFNTRWGLDPDDRPYDWAGALAGFGADLIALQEVWEPHDGSSPLPARAAELGYSLHHVALTPSFVDPRPEITPDPARADGTWGVALLSRLPVVAIREVELGRAIERWDVAARPAILADVELADGIVVAVAAVHLSFALPNAAAQLRRVRGLLPVDRPSLVVGDCNLWGPAAAALLRPWRRAVRGRTWPAHRPHSQLDHVLVSPGVHVSSAAVLPSVGSDHRPIRCTLEVPARR